MMAIVNEPVGQPVRSLQIMLRAICQYDGDVLAVIPDGIYSEDTVASVSSFQKRHGLPVTGETDLQTWYAVAAEYRRVLVEIGPAQPVNIILQKSQVIRAGETNEHLYMMHGCCAPLAVIIRLCPGFHATISTTRSRWPASGGCRSVPIWSPPAKLPD